MLRLSPFEQDSYTILLEHQGDVLGIVSATSGLNGTPRQRAHSHVACDFDAAEADVLHAALARAIVIRNRQGTAYVVAPTANVEVHSRTADDSLDYIGCVHPIRSAWRRRFLVLHFAGCVAQRAYTLIPGGRANLRPERRDAARTEIFRSATPSTQVSPRPGFAADCSLGGVT